MALFALFFAKTYASISQFYRLAQVGHEDRYKNLPADMFRELFTDHEKPEDGQAKYIHRFANRMYTRKLKSMIDNLTIGPGAGAHLSKHTKPFFRKSKPFVQKPAPKPLPAKCKISSRATTRAKNFKMYHRKAFKSN